MHRSVSQLLSGSCDVVGGVLDSTTLFEATLRLRPDVVLLDFSLPGGMKPLDICRRLRTVAPWVHIVAFTVEDDAALRDLTYDAGAEGFVNKLQAVDDLLATIRAVVDRTVRSVEDDSR
jgi:DNA-binding NarL/FixJ family response regulator